MGPSVKFVLPIIDAFPDKKMGVIFGVAKKDTTGGGGPGGVAFFGRNFSRLSFLNTSLRYILLPGIFMKIFKVPIGRALSKKQWIPTGGSVKI